MHTRKARRNIRIGSILVIAGALVLLTPLFFWGLDTWRNQASPQIEESPVMRLPANDTWQVPTPPTPNPSPPVEGQTPAKPPAVIDRSRPSFAYRLQIPTLSVNVPIQPGIDDGDLNRGAGHYPQTPLPGEKGNAALAGHRTVKGKPSYFYSLDKLQAGDPIYVVYADKQVEFKVEKIFVTDPYDLSVLSATDSSMLTLTTCDPPGTDENRLIVQARLVSISDQN